MEFLLSNADRIEKYSKEIQLMCAKAREYDALKDIIEYSQKQYPKESITEIHITMKAKLALDFKSYLKGAEVRINEAAKEKLT